MSELATPLRTQLGKTIVEARRVAEAGAKKALESLAVERHEPHGSMPPEKRSLRNRLRARGRQLGDVRDRQRGHQSIGRLTHEVAYEHWHRMLFARFLAENGLLIHPDHQIAMSVRDVEELAHETGKDPHGLAAGFAQDSLPQIFRIDDPVLEVTLAPETRQKLEVLLDSLPTEIFTADDSLGWTYQYWQAEKKDAVNASGEKIGADELPAVTQLFTEHYMVLFLYHNTLGAWHAGKVLADNPSLAETAQSEDELRKAVALKTPAGDSNWDYLRFVRVPQDGDEDDNPTGPWRPAAGTFEGWPRTAKELKVLDPCCGSGHFLVVGFKLLVRLRMHEEGLGLEDAIRVVLRDNLYGLELDLRCTQIAAFNLAIAAWKLVGKPIKLPPLNIACSGLSIGSSKKEWLDLAGNDERLGAGLENLYELFRQAPELGSLIDPKSLGDDMYIANFEELQPLLHEALAKESVNEETIERTVAAQGMAKAAELLAGEYTLVVTNVPYLTRHNHSKTLIEFVDSSHPTARTDLATVFISRIQSLLASNRSLALVAPQNWLHQYRYASFRKDLLNTNTWNFNVWLGSGAFETISGEVVKPILICLTNTPSVDKHEVVCIDTSDLGIDQKQLALSSSYGLIKLMSQKAQLKNPDSRFLFESQAIHHAQLANYCESFQGLRTGDATRFIRTFWERLSFDTNWPPFKTSSSKEQGIQSGHTHTIRWEHGRGQLHEYALATRSRLHDMHESGNRAWSIRGVAFGQITLRATYYYGEHFDNTLAVIVPKQPPDLPAIQAFCTSENYAEEVRRIERGLYVTNASLLKVPFDIEHWKSVASKKLSNGPPKPQSDNPTQWFFHGHPAKAELTTILQVAVARLLGYRWPPERDPDMQLADEAREWVARCDELKGLADDDGIVCLPAISSELPAANRLRRLLSTAFGPEWSAAKERELLAAAVGEGNKPATSLDAWLRDKFFEEHCKLFHHRPFIWHIWDGNRDGFHCLVNAHKLTGSNGEGRRTLEAIAYSYLGGWIQRQKDDQKAMIEGADARLAAAQDLQKQLEKILEGKPPYDLFVRWKPLHEQAMGWDPDINDGVRLNIRPFMNAELRKGGKRGAGILRWKPNIKWKKDRGKEPESLRPKVDFPWFWGCNGDSNASDGTDYTAERAGSTNFDGNRWNDLHYSRVVKEAARVAAKAKPEERGE